jgi:hypothetical protein
MIWQNLYEVFVWLKRHQLYLFHMGWPDDFHKIVASLKRQITYFSYIIRSVRTCTPIFKKIWSKTRYKERRIDHDIQSSKQCANRGTHRLSYFIVNAFFIILRVFKWSDKIFMKSLFDWNVITCTYFIWVGRTTFIKSSRHWNDKSLIFHRLYVISAERSHNCVSECKLQIHCIIIISWK